MNQVYNHAIANPEDLNQYEPFSPEVCLYIKVLVVLCVRVCVCVCVCVCAYLNEIVVFCESALRSLH